MPTTVEIDIDGVDITDNVLIADAFFESFVNGTPGSCEFTVKDVPGTRSIATGKDITLWINGVRDWRGFVSQVARVFMFNAEDTEGETERYFRVTGVDVNILFRKRVIFNQSDPLNGGKIYTFPGPGVDGKTSDQTALDEMFANWIDLSSDGLTVASTGTGGGIEFVGYINQNQDVEPWQAGWTWDQAMDSIAKLPGAIYYIDPDKVFIYTDPSGTGTVSDFDDLDLAEANAPFILTDNPASDDTGLDTPLLGYSEMEILADGTNLATDVLIWGMGTGSQNPVFTRITDDPENHGLWQYAEVHYDVYKQDTADRIASSILNGSARNKRGHRRDKFSVSCVVWEPGFRVAQKAVFVSESYTWVGLMPIRKVRITFEETHPRWELLLSTEIDSPWSFYDIFALKLPALQNFDIPFGIGRTKNRPVDFVNAGIGAFTSFGNSGSFPGEAQQPQSPNPPWTTAEVHGVLSGPWDSSPVDFLNWDTGSTSGNPIGDSIEINYLFANNPILSPNEWSGDWSASQTRTVWLWELPNPSVYPRITGTFSVDFQNSAFVGGGTPTTTPDSTPWTLVAVDGNTDPIPFVEDLDLSGRTVVVGLGSGSGPGSGSYAFTNPGGKLIVILRADLPTEIPGRIPFSSGGIEIAAADQLYPVTTGWYWPGQAGDFNTGLTPYGKLNIFVSDIRFSSKARVMAGIGGGGSVGAGGITGTTLQLESPYAIGSPKVFKNGLVLRRGIDYTESDPLSGVITLTDAAVESDGFQVQYRVLDPLGGNGLPSRLRTSYS